MPTLPLLQTAVLCAKIVSASLAHGLLAHSNESRVRLLAARALEHVPCSSLTLVAWIKPRLRVPVRQMPSPGWVSKWHPSMRAEKEEFGLGYSVEMTPGLDARGNGVFEDILDGQCLEGK